MEISRKETEYLKGIAILLMLAHHLFAFPERILPPSFYIPLIPGFPLEGLAGSFGKICVGVFLFLSGYGFAVNGKYSPSYYADKVFRFFRIYWFYFIVFIPVGFVFYSHVTFFSSSTLRYGRDPELLFLNFFALTFSYNGEWWFVQPYLLLVISCPVTMRLAKRPPVLLAASIVLFAAALYLQNRGLDTPYISVVWFSQWQLPFALGILAVAWKSRISAVLERAEKFSLLLTAALAITATALLWHFFLLAGLIAATPLFIYLCLLCRKRSGGSYPVFSYLGGYSFPLWLTHSFFCYYYWQKLIFLPRFSPLVFLNLVVITLAACIALEKIRKALPVFFAAVLRKTADSR